MKYRCIYDTELFDKESQLDQHFKEEHPRKLEEEVKKSYEWDIVDEKTIEAEKQAVRRAATGVVKLE